MARAGFYEIRSSTIRFGRDGCWYADDEAIQNPRITQLFSTHLVAQPDGSYRIEIGWDKAAVEIEDTPYVVRHVHGSAAEGLVVELNDETREPLLLDALVISADNVMYCPVKSGTARARFLRSAYYQLAPYIEESAPGQFALRCGRTVHPIRRA